MPVNRAANYKIMKKPNMMFGFFMLGLEKKVLTIIYMSGIIRGKQVIFNIKK